MTQIIRVYNTEANAIAGGTSVGAGLITKATIDSNIGAIHNNADTIPYFIYNKYFYRIEANEPVSEFHIDWDDGEDNSVEKRNVQIIKLETPKFFTVVEHIYTEAKRFYPMIRVKSIDGFLSKWYTNDDSDNLDDSLKAYEPQLTLLSEGENNLSELSLENAGKDLIPHFMPSNLSPIGVLKTDRSRIFSGIDNKTIDAFSGAGTYPLLYAYTTDSSKKPSVKLTVQGRDDRAIRTYIIASANIIDEDTDLDTEGSGSSSEFSKSAVPTGNFGGTPTLTDCADKLLRAELLNATTLGDNDRIYIKVFDGVRSNLSGAADVSEDAAVCVLSNGNPIVDLNDPLHTFTADGSESFTKASNIGIGTYFLDTDDLNTATIQSNTSHTDKVGNVTDTLASGFSLGSTPSKNELSYTHNNKGHLFDSDSRFLDFYRLLRIQVADNHTPVSTFGSKDVNNRKSKIEHYHHSRYKSTADSSGNELRAPSNEGSSNLLLFSNDVSSAEESMWHNIGEDVALTNATMIGGTYSSSTSSTSLRYGSNDTTNSNTVIPHPQNHILVVKGEIFDRLYFRLNNTYANSDSATDVQITGLYSHADGWKPLEIIDKTIGLKTSGVIRFNRPNDWAKTNSAGIESGSWSGPIPPASSEETSSTAEVSTVTCIADVSHSSLSGEDGLTTYHTGTTTIGNYFLYSSTTTNYYVYYRQNAVAEQTQIDLNTSNNKSVYATRTISLYDTSGNEYEFWFNTGSESAPGGGAGHFSKEVDISAVGVVTDADVAAILDAAIEGPGGYVISATSSVSSADPFTSSVSTARVSVTANTAGPTTDGTMHPTLGTITTVQQGKSQSSDPATVEASALSGKTGIFVAYDDGDSANTIAGNTRTKLTSSLSGVATISGSAAEVIITNAAGGNTTNTADSDGSSDTGSLDLTTGFGFATSTPGVDAVANTEDPATLWTENGYGILLSINVKSSDGSDSGKIAITNIWAYNNEHSRLLKVIDPHHLSLNDIAISQSISYTRSGKVIPITSRFGKSEIRKIGANGGKVTFGGVDFGDTDSQGNRKKIKRLQQDLVPVYLDVTHQSGEKTRLYGVIESMSEDFPTGKQYPKYALSMVVSHLVELNSAGNLLSDKISLGGNYNDVGQYISSS